MSNNLELAVIGNMIAEPACISEVAAVLKSTDFARREVGQMFSMIQTLHAGGKPVGDITYLRSAVGDLIGDGPNRIGEVELRNAIVDSDVANVLHYCQQLKEVSQRAALLQLSARIAGRINSGHRPAEIIMDAETQLAEIRNRLLSGTLEEDIHIAMRDVVLRLQTPEDRVSFRIMTGLPTLDSMIYGIPVPSLWLFGAGTSKGKTAFALQQAMRAANDGLSVYVFSLEMEWTEVAERVQSMFGISMDTWANPDGLPASVIDPIVQKGLENAKLAEAWNFKVNRESTYDIESICRRARAQKASVSGLDLLIVDYLALIESRSNLDQRNRFNEITRRLKRLSKELGCCVMLLAQLSEDAIKNRVLDNSAWAESKYISNDANVAQLLQETDDPSIRLLWTTKNRSGEKDFGINLRFDVKYQTFSEVDGHVFRSK